MANTYEAWKGAVEPAESAPSGNAYQAWKGAVEPVGAAGSTVVTQNATISLGMTVYPAAASSVITQTATKQLQITTVQGTIDRVQHGTSPALKITTYKVAFGNSVVVNAETKALGITTYKAFERIDADTRQLLIYTHKATIGPSSSEPESVFGALSKPASDGVSN